MSKTIIAWTDFTFNPWMGCSKVSAGCKNCYAEGLVKNRMRLDVWGNNSKRQITKSTWNNLTKEKNLAKNKVNGVLGSGFPRLVFVGSLMDWAEDRDEVGDARERTWEFIRRSPELHFQLLTKRPENILKFLPKDWGEGFENVWLGTSVENNEVKNRIEILSDIPAKIRFISYEPAIGELTNVDLSKIHWLIYGGESGPGRRPENKQWARDIWKLCREQNTAFFHKQSAGHRTEMGIELDGKIVREFPFKEIARIKESKQEAMF